MKKINLIQTADQIQNWDNFILNNTVYDDQSIERFYDIAKAVFIDNRCVKGGLLKMIWKDAYFPEQRMEIILKARVGDIAYFNENGLHREDGDPAYISITGNEVYFSNGEIYKDLPAHAVRYNTSTIFYQSHAGYSIPDDSVDTPI